jgi:hypothetical protein
MQPMIKQSAPLELSDGDLDAVCGGQVVVGGLAAVLAQVALNAAVANVTLGNFNQRTGDQTILITG